MLLVKKGPGTNLGITSRESEHLLRQCPRRQGLRSGAVKSVHTPQEERHDQHLLLTQTDGQRGKEYGEGENRAETTRIVAAAHLDDSITAGAIVL
jgi:hypothetical protein